MFVVFTHFFVFPGSIQEIGKLTGGGADYSFECIGVSSVMTDAFTSTKPVTLSSHLSRCILHFPTSTSFRRQPACKQMSWQLPPLLVSGQGQDDHPGRGERPRANLTAVHGPPVRQVRHGLLLRRAQTQDWRPSPRLEMHEQGAAAGRAGHAWSRPAGDQQGLRPAPAGELPQVQHMDGQVNVTITIVGLCPKRIRSPSFSVSSLCLLNKFEFFVGVPYIIKVIFFM